MSHRGIVRSHLCVAGLAVFCTFANSALAQRTTIQLPTFQNFGMSTTVLVPDRGSVYAGGVNRSFRSTSRRGIPLAPGLARSSSNGVSSSGVQVSAYIHDLEQLDREVIDRWKQSVKTRAPEAASAVAHKHENVHAQPRVSAVRERVQQQGRAKREQARRYASSAWRLEKKGKYAAALTVYRNALKLADEPLARKVRDRIELINGLAVRKQQGPRR